MGMPYTRSKKGVTTVALVLFLAFFAILPLAIFGFELARYTLMQSQLQSCTDAAALAGTAALASSPTGRTIAEQHQLAMDVAALTFEQNTILQTRFSNPTNLVVHFNNGWDSTPPPLHAATINIRLLNQSGNPEPTGSQNATTMRVEALYTDQSIFLSNIFPAGFRETAAVYADGGLPQLDLFLCFDCSGSMDDKTPVTLVRRQWNGATQQVSYVSVVSDEIYPLCRPPKEGTGFNAMQPQNLSYASYGSPSNGRTWIFSESVNPSGNLLAGLRGNRTTYPPGSLPAPIPASATQYPLGSLVPEQGLPPGNFDPTNRTNSNGNSITPDSYANGFTDMVVRVSNVGSFDFSRVETCVEASRGNMENSTVLLQSQGGVAINPILPPPQAGYYKAYWDQVRKEAQPITDSRNASVNFFNIMNTSSNAHFGLETFADTAGTSPTSTYTGISHNSDSNWAHGGIQSFPIPFIGLNKTASNFNDVVDAVQGTGASTMSLGATGKTNIADALEKAIDDLTDPSKYRPRAKKAIVLFTDGIPNRPNNESDGQSLALAQAVRAERANIPIYTIGLSQNPDIISRQDALLSDDRTPPKSGIAAKSADGALYIRVNDSAALNQAFQTIARSLVVLQQ
jgi:Flp pilus assembly protein TadG